MGRTFLEKFEALSVPGQSWAIVVLALAGANPMTVLFYGLFFQERLVLDLVLTSLIVVVVGWPIAYFFLRQQARLKSMAGKLVWAANYDDLTKMTNRRTFIEKAAAMIDADDSGKGVGALLYLDVDRFKSINDTFGHAAGDKLLVALSAAIRSCVRDGDLAGRIGGEEFAVLLAHAGSDEARRVAERIRLAVSKVSDSTGIIDRKITISIGLVLHRPGQSLDETMSQADQFLYAAKEQGRDRVVHEGASLEAA